MDLSFLIYFLAGILQDLIFTLNIRFVALKKIPLAVLTSFLTVVVSTFVLYNILSDLDEARSIPAIIVYAAGIATGTFVAMKLNIEKNKGP